MLRIASSRSPEFWSLLGDLPEPSSDPTNILEDWMNSDYYFAWEADYDFDLNDGQGRDNGDDDEDGSKPNSKRRKVGNQDSSEEVSFEEDDFGRVLPVTRPGTWPDMVLRALQELDDPEGI
jgi:hypothetical protein